MDELKALLIGVLVTVVAAAAIALARWVVKTHKRMMLMADDMLGTPGRPGVPRRPGVMERLLSQDEALTDLQHSMTKVNEILGPKNGKTLGEKVDHLWRQLPMSDRERAH